MIFHMSSFKPAIFICYFFYFKFFINKIHVSISQYKLFVISVCQTRDLPSDFLQIPPLDGHPCCSAIHFPLSGYVWGFHLLERAHGAQTKRAPLGAPPRKKRLSPDAFKKMCSICYFGKLGLIGKTHHSVHPSFYFLKHQNFLSHFMDNRQPYEWLYYRKNCGHPSDNIIVLYLAETFSNIPNIIKRICPKHEFCSGILYGFFDIFF